MREITLRGLPVTWAFSYTPKCVIIVEIGHTTVHLTRVTLFGYNIKFQSIDTKVLADLFKEISDFGSR